jgi:hypothetical protein
MLMTQIVNPILAGNCWNLFLTLDRPQTVEIQGINHTFDGRFANEFAILYDQKDLTQLAGGSEFHRNTLLPIKSELSFEIIKQFRWLRVLDPGYAVSEHLESGPSGPSPIIHRPTLSLAIAPVKLFGRVLFKLRMPGLGRNMGLRVELAPLCHRLLTHALARNDVQYIGQTTCS